MWRVVTGRHNITLSFSLPGHTKIGPDWCLGFFKRRFRKTRVDCMADIVQVATAASSTGILTPQLCGDEAGNVLVPSRDWTAFLSEWFWKLVGLRRSTISSSKPAGRSCAVKMWQVRSRSSVCSRDLLPCRTRNPLSFSHPAWASRGENISFRRSGNSLIKTTRTWCAQNIPSLILQQSSSPTCTQSSCQALSQRRYLYCHHLDPRTTKTTTTTTTKEKEKKKKEKKKKKKKKERKKERHGCQEEVIEQFDAKRTVNIMWVCGCLLVVVLS